MNEWVVYSRPGCSLCEEFMTELAAFLGERAASVRVVNIDDDDDLIRKYFDRIPVLTVASELVCQYRFDAERVKQYLAN